MNAPHQLNEFLTIKSIADNSYDWQEKCVELPYALCAMLQALGLFSFVLCHLPYQRRPDGPGYLGLG